jgi:DNA end-binding protein Ku
VVLEPRGDGIVLWTLRFGDEVRQEKGYFEDIEDNSDPELVPLVQTLIKQKTAHWSPKMVSDPIQEALLSIIAAKKKALKPSKKGKAKAEDPPARGNVVDIMSALKQSLAAESRSGRKAG